MCEPELEAKYKALAQGRTILESCLHHNLAEHINSEIGLGTITSISSAKEWLHNSFLFQRIQKNPRHYAIGKNVDQSWQDRIDEMVTDSVKLLKETQLVEGEQDKIRNDESLYSTGFGDIMSKVGFLFPRHTIARNSRGLQYYIRQSTVRTCCSPICAVNRFHFQMKNILQLEDKATLRELVSDCTSNRALIA